MYRSTNLLTCIYIYIYIYIYKYIYTGSAGRAEPFKSAAPFGAACWILNWMLSGNITPPLSPPWRTAPPADPDQTNRVFFQFVRQSRWLKLLADFLPSQKLIQKHIRPKLTKSQKTRPWAPNGSMLVTFWHHLNTHFSLNFVAHPYRTNCNKHCVKQYFYNFRASKIHWHFMFFRDTLLDNVVHPFIHFYVKKSICGPLQNPIGVKWRKNINEISQIMNFSRSWNRLASKRSTKSPGSHFEWFVVHFWLQSKQIWTQSWHRL